MSQEIIPLSEMQALATAAVGSNFFPGVKTKEAALVLMALAQAEGLAPIVAMMRYDVIDGKPAKKASAMLGDFLAAKGTVEWHQHDAKACEATFTHPTGGSIRVRWDMDKAKAAGLLGKQNWQKYPEAMLHARCVSSGVRFVYPAATGGLYDPSEVADFDDKPAPKTKPATRGADKLAEHFAAPAPVQEASFEDVPPPVEQDALADIPPPPAFVQADVLSAAPMTKLATPSVNADRIPADVLRLSRKLIALPFSDMQPDMLKAQLEMLKGMTAKAKDANNRSVLALVAAIAEGAYNEMMKE
jgi:hypothetical protein